jgi:hypothetical protein
VEKQEIPKLTTAIATAKGYYVPGVLSSTTSLPDYPPVKISSCILLHLYEASTSPNIAGKVDFALKEYSGHRPKVIAKWRACESGLIALPFTEYQIVNFATPLRVFEDKIMAALKMACAFTPNAKVHITTPTGPKLVKFRETLFPR